jgi:hypothetical protein
MISTPEDMRSADLILLIGYLSIYIDEIAKHFYEGHMGPGDKVSPQEVDAVLSFFYDYAALRQLIELNFSYPCITSKLHAGEVKRIDKMLKSLGRLSKKNASASVDYLAACTLINKYYSQTPKDTSDLSEDAYLMYVQDPESLYPEAFPEQDALFDLAKEYGDELVDYKKRLAEGA